ncbi:glycoside hydrolase family 43 protein [Microbacterium elymi]|uniref:Glycoside hydrolase family 43 protein n=1 Tax=Microbacterium elymi TaxID=2909587 RepID=A0ABY5NLX2_9MICO|nr:glycoside hydrolase family 43 protein [Microbacterium elymi]UUT36165.1 glycoside hydrolase family 43 protein [Microbacterium elymi]
MEGAAGGGEVAGGRAVTPVPIATNPMLGGFHPDPTIARGTDGAYYLVTSSFEYLPALPVHRSTDLREWELIGHVATRDEQVALARVPTPGGVWAPTLRFHDGRFHLIVSVFLGGRGCVVFTATDPAGPWDDGVVIDAVDGIDPDLAWDDDGTAYVTFARHPDAIRQVRVDLSTGRALERVRPLWAGSGLYSPEGPHLYRRGDWWYLLAAEGGTDRGHAVTVARSRRPDGPFESAPQNPILTAAGTGAPIQNTGHADLFDDPDGATRMVLLGVRPVGLAQSFSPLGRETFITTVDWIDEWPCVRMPQLAASRTEDARYDFTTGLGVADPEWVAVRRAPSQLVTASMQGLVFEGDDRTMNAPDPCFVGQRQRHLEVDIRAVLDVRAGTGGLAVRNAEDNWFGIEARGVDNHVVVTGRAVIAGLDHNWEAMLPAGDVQLRISMTPPPGDFSVGAVGGDIIRLFACSHGEPILLAELDGRHWSFETAKAFTGRVFGIFAASGRIVLRTLDYFGRD